jgi:multimeric flavodoxin WrbA
MKVLGVSGSPIRDGNTDRALKVALNATGAETEFLKLIDYTVAPCRACLGCLRTNTCVLEDDGILLARKAREADALIIAGYTPYSSLDSRTKAFIERLYPLRHIHGFMRGKPGGAIVTCAIPSGTESLPPAGDMGANAIMFYMMEEGMDFQGSVKVLGNVPCVKCGSGDSCAMSAIKLIHGPDATVESAGINTFEAQPAVVEQVKALGERIGNIVRRRAKM